MHLDPDDDQWPRWLDLLDRVRNDIASVVDEFMSRVRSLQAYQSHVVPQHQVRADASRIFIYLLSQMDGRGELTSQAALAGRRLGRDRARAGVPLGDLLAAVRLDSQVLWGSLRAHTGPEEQDLLIAAVEIIWLAVENYSTNVRRGYAEEEERAHAQTTTERTRLISAMISNPDQNDEAWHNLAALFGTEVTARFAVVGSDIAHETEIRRVAVACMASQQAVHIHPHGGLNLLFVQHRSDDLTSLRRLLGGFPSVIAPLTHGVANLRRSCLLVIEAIHLGLAVDPWPLEIRSQWLQLVSARAQMVFPEIAHPVHHALDQLRPAELERILSTALFYAECGSIAETAERSFCHRNTVLTRLNRLTELTGYDMAVPAQAAVLQMALLARPDYRAFSPPHTI